MLEVPGSYKIGLYLPGTLIPIDDEARLFDEQPEYALLLAWHIADELAPKLKANGFRGDFIVTRGVILKISFCSLLTMLLSPVVFWVLFRFAALFRHTIRYDSLKTRAQA